MNERSQGLNNFGDAIMFRGIYVVVGCETAVPGLDATEDMFSCSPSLAHRIKQGDPWLMLIAKDLSRMSVTNTHGCQGNRRTWPTTPPDFTHQL